MSEQPITTLPGKIATTFSKIAMGICGAAIGAACAMAAFQNGASMAAGIDGAILGTAFAATAIGSWFIPHTAAEAKNNRKWAEAVMLYAGAAVCIVFTVANAVGYSATHRTNTTSSKTVAIDAYKQATATLNAATTELATMKTNPRWEATNGCTNATAGKSVSFCEAITATQAKIAAAGNTAAKGRPGSPDAAADIIGWVIQIPANNVARGLPVFWAAVLEIAAVTLISSALNTRGTQKKPRPAATPPANRNSSAEPAFPALAAVNRNTLAKNYQQLSRSERNRVAELKCNGYSIRKIAEIVKRSPATVCREFKRNTLEQQRYNPKIADQLAMARKIRA